MAIKLILFCLTYILIGAFVIYMFNKQCTDKFWAIDINDLFDFGTALAFWPVIIIYALFRLLAKIVALFGKAAIIIFTTVEYLIKALLGGNDGTNN